MPQLLESYMALLSTRVGSMAAAMCAAHGGAKERKRMMRALKGYVASSLVHRYDSIGEVPVMSLAGCLRFCNWVRKFRSIQEKN